MECEVGNVAFPQPSITTYNFEMKFKDLVHTSNEKFPHLPVLYTVALYPAIILLQKVDSKAKKKLV